MHDGAVSELNTMTFRPQRAPARQAMPALTILAHPRADVVPSRTYLSGRVELGRNEPTFEPLGKGRPTGLDDPFLSRKPIVFTARDDGVEIDPSGTKTHVQVDADPEALDRATFFDSQRLEDGVVLCLSGRVTLLLHRVSPFEGGDSGAFGLVGHSAAIARVRRDIETVAGVEAPVLIRGESGTGKELIARAIHDHSERASAHYEAVNMATIAGSLAASELFGHAKGAFTGADRAHDGYFTRADGGTLFLDEIGDTPVDIQPQLLRVLETHDIRPVGGRQSKRIDVRIISATDVDLESAIASGRFRQALLQRLAGFQINVPALRERREDIGTLCYHFIRAELGPLGQLALLQPADTRHPWLPAAVVARLARHDWPGNVRQLRNVVRQLVIAGRNRPELCDLADVERLLTPASASGPILRPVSSPGVVPLVPLVPTVPTVPVAPATQAPMAPPIEPKPAPRARPRASGRANYRDPTDVSEEEMLVALRAHGYKLAPTARALNLSRTSLYSMVDQSDRVRKAADLTAAEIEAALRDANGKLAAAARALEVSNHALKLRMRALDLVR